MFILLQIDINCLKHIVKQLGSQLEKLWLANCSRVTGAHILPLIQVFECNYPHLSLFSNKPLFLSPFNFDCVISCR